MVANFKKSAVFAAIFLIVNSAYADTSLGSDLNNVSVTVNADNGAVGAFIVYNGTTNPFITFSTAENITSINSYNSDGTTLS